MSENKKTRKKHDQPRVHPVKEKTRILNGGVPYNGQSTEFV